MTDLIIRAITGKEIVVVYGIPELLSELKIMGRNLNQLTTLANMSKMDTIYLADTKVALSDLYATARWPENFAEAPCLLGSNLPAI